MDFNGLYVSVFCGDWTLHYHYVCNIIISKIILLAGLYPIHFTVTIAET